MENKKRSKYYLIEKYIYREEVDGCTEQPGAPDLSKSFTTYDVKTFDSKEKLKKALLEGPKHGGKLTLAKHIPLKLELVV